MGMKFKYNNIFHRMLVMGDLSIGRLCHVVHCGDNTHCHVVVSTLCQWAMIQVTIVGFTITHNEFLVGKQPICELF